MWFPAGFPCRLLWLRIPTRTPDKQQSSLDDFPRGEGGPALDCLDVEQLGVDRSGSPRSDGIRAGSIGRKRVIGRRVYAAICTYEVHR